MGMGTVVSALFALILACTLVLGGCSAATPRRAPDVSKTTQKAVQKIDRICALPPVERDAELKKLEAQTGVVLFCGPHP